MRPHALPVLLLPALLLIGGPAGCERQGDEFENAGEKIDETIDEAADKAEDIADELEDTGGG